MKMKQNVTSDKYNSLLNINDNKKLFIQEMVEHGNISEDTSKSYERVLLHTSELEDSLDKDLNEFDLQELETVLFAFKANNRNTVESYARIISSYLNWSVQKNLSDFNPLSELKPNDFVKYLTNEESYFTEKQIRRMEDHLVNYQDAVVLRLLFLGVGGKQMSEIRNLKKDDIDRINKRIKLTNTLKSDTKGLPIKFTERYIDIDDEHTFDLIEGAISVNRYMKRNGEVSEGSEARSIGYLDLVENDYVIRSSITKTDNYDYPVDKFVIYRRVNMIAEVFGIEILTTKLIQRSGMIYYGSKLMQNKRITLDDMKIIADRFNIASYHNLKGFLTIENIEKTYGNGNKTGEVF